MTAAEAGANSAVTLLGQSRTATNSCRIGTSSVCDSSDGQYQTRWVTSGSQITITSVGYYPTRAAPVFTRAVEITYEPIPSFKYAIFSQTSLSVANNMTVVGDVYSAGDVTVGQGATVCGSIISSGGGVTLVNSSNIVKTYAPLGVYRQVGERLDRRCQRHHRCLHRLHRGKPPSVEPVHGHV